MAIDAPSSSSKAWVLQGLAFGAAVAVALGTRAYLSLGRFAKFRSRVVGIIPARFASSRFPGKPLVHILGKPMIQRTWERAKMATTLDRIVVATDDEKIAECCRGFGADVIMTSESCRNGTERCNEALQKLGKKYDIVVNIQGDEPLFEPEIVDGIVKALQVAAKVIGEVQALIIFPVIPYFILAVFYMFWFSAALHLFSSGQVLENNCNSNCCAYVLELRRVSCDRCCGYSIHYTSHIGAAILFHLFGCYWATQFFIACSSTVIAGSVASYYWNRGETSPEIPFLPVFSSMKRLMRYSLGSVALGSLIVSFVESIRFILDAIRRKLKVVNVPESWIGRVAFHSSQFSRRGIEWTIKSVNRNAYIMIAITGKSFFKASEIATELIISNILRIGKVNVIGDVILFLGKLCVSLSSAVFAFLMLDTHNYASAHNKISSPLFPVLVCWGLGYVVATLFFGVVEMSIDTIILSFCQDSDEHQGTAQYAPPLLIETLNDQNEMQRLTQ